MASNSNYFPFSLLIIIFILSLKHTNTMLSLRVSNETLCNGLLTTDKFKQKSIMYGTYIVEDTYIRTLGRRATMIVAS